MDNKIPIMMRIISSAVSVATRAGIEVRKVASSDCKGVVDKGVQDFQTEADRRAQRLIVASLAKRFPRCTIVGEEDLVEDKAADAELLNEGFDEDVLQKSPSMPEQYKDIEENELTIWVDPLDGTAEFLKGFYEHVTVLIGISYKGQAVAGVIHQPFYGAKKSITEGQGRTLWGLVGLGCFGPIDQPKNPGDRLVVTTTASHGNEDIENSIKALKPDEILRVGGAGHKVLLVIERKAQLYVFASNGSKRWDTCAPEAVLRSAGGKLTDVLGDTINYNFDSNSNYQNYLGVIASTDDQNHQKVVEAIPSSIKEKLVQFKNQDFKSKY